MTDYRTWLGRPAPLDTVGGNAAGDLWIAPSLIALVDPDLAWLGMRELHHAAIGADGFRYATDAARLWPDEAFGAYSSTVVAALGQIAATEPSVGNRLLGSICDAADLYGGFDGLESVASAAFQSAGRLGVVTPEMEQFQWLTSALGAPDRSGGGAATSTILDVGARALGHPEIGRIGHLFTHATDAHSLAAGLADLARDAGGGSDVQQAAGKVGEVIASTAAGAAAGASLGSFLPGIGTVAGGIIGGAIGFFESIFGGSHSEHTSREHAAGDKVAVHADIRVETPGGQPYVVHVDATVTPSTSAPPAATPPPSGGKCPEPRPDRCQVDENQIDPDYAVPFWAEQSGLVGGMVPIGPGRAGLFQRSPGGALVLGDMPSVSELGVLREAGQVFQDLLAGTDRITAVRPDPAGIQRWTRYVPDTASWTVPTYQKYVVEVLQRAGVTPETRVRDAVDLLRQYQLDRLYPTY